MLVDLLTALAAVILLSQLLGRLFARLHQPPVIGEILAGLALGPSLLGRFFPEVQHAIFPAAALTPVNATAQLGVVLYMFLVGLELDAGVVRRQLRATLALAGSTIVVPLLGGAALALVLYPRFSPASVPQGIFVLFISVSMCVTAFPVLARILADRGMTQTWLGVLALASAAVADVCAWCLLAVVIGLVRTDANPLTVVLTTVVFVGAMLFLVRPAIKRVVARLDRDSPAETSIAFELVAMLVSALITEAVGIHAIFGAFLMGAVIPHDSGMARRLLGVKHVLAVLLLPAYFAYAGLRTDTGLVTGWGDWLFCLAIILVASAGKFAGAWIAAPIARMSWRDASAFGALMNARGLMELIVLNIGLDVGVITPRLFTLLVIMAVTTTLMSSPALRILLGPLPAEALANSPRP